MASQLHVHCSTATLREALSFLHPVIPSRTTIPALECVHIHADSDSLELTATNTEIRLRTRCPARTTQAGSALVPAKLLWDVVRRLEEDEEIALLSQDTTAILETAYGRFQIAGLSPEEFPAASELPEPSLELPAEVVSNVLQHVRFAASRESLRPALTGILWEFRPDSIIAVATDGYRLSRFRFPSTLDYHGTVLIPADTLDLLRRAASSLHIGWNSTHVVIADSHFTLWSRLIGEKFPDYERVIPTESTRRCVVSRERLLKALDRVSLFAPTSARIVRLHLQADTLHLQAEDETRGDRAQEAVPCQYSGEPLLIGFNAIYLSEALKAAQKESLLLEFTEPTRPVLLRWAESEDVPVLKSPLAIVVMPVRL